MGESDDPSLFRSVKAKAKAVGLRQNTDKEPILPILPIHSPFFNHSSPSSPSRVNSIIEAQVASERPYHDPHSNAKDNVVDKRDGSAHDNNFTDKTAHASCLPTPNSPPNKSEDASAGPTAIDPKLPMFTRMKHGTVRFIKHLKNAITYSWINVLLVFVPIGIAAKLAGLSPVIIFSMNAIAIIPLAGLLAHATEAVAVRLGDTLGALLNVSFGNAVELILFIILLASNQIRVVQAALLGSILANLLLILGMAFLFGGLRYQEQVYNSTVTQMSACMLSLAVMSLLLPTAFHAAFQDNTLADQRTLQVSRGTSVVLLLVYALYLIFQLKSHAYMYASTPQHIIDEESHPGVLADMMHHHHHSSSSDSSSDSSSSSSESDAGSQHTTTTKRIKRAFRKRKRRRSITSSKGTAPSIMTPSSVEQRKNYFDFVKSSTPNVEDATLANPLSRRGSVLNAVMSGDEADTDEHTNVPVVRDFEASSSLSATKGKREKKSKHKKKHRKHADEYPNEKEALTTGAPSAIVEVDNTNMVAFPDEVQQSDMPKRRSGLPSLLLTNVFNNPQNPPPPPGAGTTNVRIAGPRTLRRTTSLPDRMNRFSSQPATQNNGPSPLQHVPSGNAVAVLEEVEGEPVPEMSRTVAVVMLIISTALVAVCADFMSDAIEPMVETSNVSQAFIGLIILPIVGNAAEHVTAVTVAAKNKMDLAIGVAVGSSIQIAIFITPFVVLLGWAMSKDMSLYFNIFETVSLFVTAFVVNFLILDGRSNYLEGSLLMAAYVIIALATFFYPEGCQASAVGGSDIKACPGVGAVSMMMG
ncbi:hypothetical protein K504DRAFT_467969 [Pleomassaria siparia CBS 279.74]|uniref:Sodium/calcium exchanger membrane region domain-containing protein n=1 Tax=Pleomassaria siparia CBS 279.74 TaxID=1314801 RepID=A0A6G1K7Y5_9PLEO|nr:hypothetical protein K504DRAFT_467969 [Pleomassaria siparia CBS 279.74]